MSDTVLNPGDEIIFAGKKFTLIERRFGNGPSPMWLVSETDSAVDKFRLLCEADINRQPSNRADLGSL